MRPDTALVHVQWGNHEVGTTQPVAEVVAGCRERGVLVHVDAAQAVGHEPIAFGELGADLLSVSGHKLGAPAGTGALLVRRGLRLRAAARRRRPGAGPTGRPGGRPRPGRVRRRRGRARRRPVASTTRRPHSGGSPTGCSTRSATSTGWWPTAIPIGRLPHLVCLGVLGIEPQAVLLGLDRAGIAAHSGSACSSESLEPSPVLEAMGVDAHRSLRISVGWSSTDADIDRLLGALPEVIADLRRLGTTS